MSQPPNELFLASCGVFRRWTLSIYGENQPIKKRAFATAYALVGRRDDSCLRLVHPNVSRRHAYLQALPGGIFCVDLGSRLGLRLNGTDCRRGWLRAGQRAQIGPFALELPATNQTKWLASSSLIPTDPLAECAPEDAPLAPVVGTFSEGDKVLAEWRMNRVVALVGRSKRCRVSVVDPSVSLLHCSLVRTPLGLWVVDLLSRTGTFLNGQPVQCDRIREGDRLQVGNYELRFWYQQPKPKVVVALATRTEEFRPPEPVPESLPAPLLPEASRSLPVPAGSRQTMLYGSQLPETQTAVTEINTGRTALARNADRDHAEGSLVVALVNHFDLMQQQMFGQFQESLLMATQRFASLHQEQMAAVQKEFADLRGIAGELRALQQELTKNLATTHPSPAAPANQVQELIETGVREPAPAAAKQALAGAAPGTATPVKEDTASGDGDVHAWLTQRIAALQDEQQSRWSKLLGMILGS